MQNKMSCALMMLLLACGPAAAQSDRMVDGKAAYKKYCASCHDQGIQGAPIIKDAKQWADRSDLWDGMLVEHAKKGYIDMPAKGGNPDLGDYEVRAATEYMLTITHPEMPPD